MPTYRVTMWLDYRPTTTAADSAFGTRSPTSLRDKWWHFNATATNETNLKKVLDDEIRAMCKNDIAADLGITPAQVTDVYAFQLSGWYVLNGARHEGFGPISVNSSNPINPWIFPAAVGGPPSYQMHAGCSWYELV